MAQTMELMNAGAQAFANMATAAQNGINATDNDQGDNDGNAPPAQSSTAGDVSQPAGPASGVAGPDLAEFARRLERIEERLNTLEAASLKSRRKPAKKSRAH